MEFGADLARGILLRRYKRFFADVRLDDGRAVTAHVANTGAMLGLADPGRAVGLLHVPDPRRKLAWNLELVRVGETWVGVNTGRANRIVEEALHERRLAPLRGYETLLRERPYGEGSRIDFLLEGTPGRCFVEVKNVTLAEGRLARFPDAVTTRGRKHLRELSAVARAGDRAVMLFLVNRADCTAVSPAREIDPAYGRALDAAQDAGVELLAWRCDADLDGIRIARRVPVRP